MGNDLEPQVTLPWLIRLRWLALAGQLLAFAAARWVLDIKLGWSTYLGVSFATLATNLLLIRSRRGLWGDGTPSRLIGMVLAFDTALLTALLAASGGAMNPFTVFYLVHITLSAVVLSASWTTLIAGLSVLGFGLLFLLPRDPHAFHRAAGLQNHLYGMWLAFVLASGFTAVFVRRVTQAIRAQRDEIAGLREAAARNARLASLTTLAAGAAHELGTPLGTIAVAAHEAIALAARLPGAQAVAEDLRLIELETERCRDILSQMTVRASEHPSAPPVVTADALRQRLRAHLGDARLGRVELRLGEPTSEVRAPAEALAQSIAALVQNGIEASSSSERVVVDLARDATFVSISVEDSGAGIPPELLARVGEPFFTTKQPGRGLGLGVFLARAFVESHGGALAFEPRTGGGTRAVLRIPARGADLRMTEGQHHFLLVDDDERFRDRLSRALGDRGHRVHAVSDHAGAIALAKTNRFERVVVDLRMPGPNGLQVIRDLLALDSALEIVVLTGYGSIATAVEAVRLGARDYLTKPCHADRVLAAFDAEPESSEPPTFETPSLARLEREHIERVLRECNGNISRTARLLGVHRRTLQYKLAKYPVTR